MTKYYLKSNSEDELWLSLESAEIVKREYDSTDEKNIPPKVDINNTNPDPWAPSGRFHRVVNSEYLLDVIGTIYKETGNEIEVFDGSIIPEKLPIEGYHANLKVIGENSTLTEDQLNVLPVIEAPTTPQRIWAGE